MAPSFRSGARAAGSERAICRSALVAGLVVSSVEAVTSAVRAFGNLVAFGYVRLLMTPCTSKVAGLSGGFASLGCHADHFP